MTDGEAWATIAAAFDKDTAIHEDVLTALLRAERNVDPITATASLDDLVNAKVLSITVMARDPPQRWYRRARRGSPPAEQR